jgi:two-component system, LytTR family, response regulator
MRVLIIDDEPLAQTALANILSTRSDVESFDSANDAVEALDKVSKTPYDVLLLDINMPEMSGMEFLQQVNEGDSHARSVIVVSAHKDHALDAFDKHALDYVLKPFSDERVHEALDLAYRRTEGERAAKLVESLPQLQKISRRENSRIAIKGSGRILFVAPDEVIAVQAQGNYVLLQRAAGSDLLRESISVMADKLEPYGFIRIHRSTLVNTSFVEEIRPRLTGEYRLRVKGGKEYTVTRTYKKNLKALAEFWIGTDNFLAQ